MSELTRLQTFPSYDVTPDELALPAHVPSLPMRDGNITVGYLPSQIKTFDKFPPTVRAYRFLGAVVVSLEETPEVPIPFGVDHFREEESVISEQKATQLAFERQGNLWVPNVLTDEPLSETDHALFSTLAQRYIIHTKQKIEKREFGPPQPS
jgi:hypothetical protein